MQIRKKNNKTFYIAIIFHTLLTACSGMLVDKYTYNDTKSAKDYGEKYYPYQNISILDVNEENRELLLYSINRNLENSYNVLNNYISTYKNELSTDPNELSKTIKNQNNIQTDDDRKIFSVFTDKEGNLKHSDEVSKHFIPNNIKELKILKKKNSIAMPDYIANYLADFNREMDKEYKIKKGNKEEMRSNVQQQFVWYDQDQEDITDKLNNNIRSENRFWHEFYNMKHE